MSVCWKFAVCLLFLWLQSTSTIASGPWKQVFVSNYDLTFYDKYFLNWTDAKSFCEGIDAELVLLKDSGVVNTVLNGIEGANVEIFWLGATGTQGKDWTWIDDTKVDDSLFAWGDVEPNNEDRLYIRRLTKTVGDAMHDYAKAGAICQRRRKSKIITLGKYRLGFYLFSEAGISYGRSYSDAQSFCGTKQSRLVVLTDSTETIIKRYISVNDPYWVVSKSGGCKVLVKNLEKTRDCNKENFPICEQAGANSVTPSQSLLKISDNGETEVRCTADGYPPPSVIWKINDADVSSTLDDSVYQTRGIGNSTLFLNNAKVSDEGNYTCFANNSYSDKTFSATNFSQITVPSVPIISSITPYFCNTSFVIVWKPHRRAVGVKHRIRLEDTDGNTSDGFQVPEDIVDQFFYTGNLTFSWSQYTITIQPCSTASCYPYEIENISYTGGVPEKVTTPSLQKVNGKCQVSWNFPLKTPKNVIEGYQIDVHSTSAQESSSNKPKILNDFVDSTKISYNISEAPNRKYIVSIKAKTCAGFGESAYAIGVCVTDTAAPDSIAKPESSGYISEQGTFTFDILAPNETNGIISCIFVIVQRGDTANDLSSITEDYLRNLSSSNGSNYISIVSSPRSLQVVNSKFSFTVGDGSTTNCNIREIAATSRSTSNSQSIYKAENKKLTKTYSYLISIVTSTPSNNSGVAFQISEPLRISIPTAGTSVWIAVLVPLIVLGLLAFALVYYFRRRRSSTKQPISNNLSDASFNELRNREKIVQNEELAASSSTVVNTDIAAEAIYVNERSQTDVAMDDFEKYFDNLSKNGNAAIQEQFKNIIEESKAEMKSMSVALQANLKKKNRYKNVLPFDSTRVLIQGNESGYINACYIDGFDKRSKYIATQGPLTSTATDFWLMVVEQQCGVIVMLAKCFEAGKKKCYKYWPDEGKSLTSGSISVKNIEEVKLSGYIRRTFHLKMEASSESVEVFQFQFSSWPDHGVPHTTSNLMRLHRAVTEAYRKAPKSGCLIVHCSAGAGRTGTFIGFDILSEQAKKVNRVDVFNCVMKMRSQRIDMVQTSNQYILLHKLVLENHLFFDTDIPSQEFQSYFEKIKRDNTILTSEFAMLSRVKEPDSAKIKGRSQKNQGANLTEIVPFDRNILTIQKQAEEVESPYINASWIETYDESVSMIAAQAPIATTVEYFWRAILSYKIRNIVMLASSREVFQYWTSPIGATSNFGALSVVLETEEDDGSVTERCFTVSDGFEQISVTHFQYNDWQPNACPNDTRSVLQLVQKLQEGYRERNSNILVHCRDGAGRTGTLCAIINLIERLKSENKVDFFRAVKDLRECRMGMVQSLDQYFFCHQVISDYLKSFELYSNFADNSANLYSSVS